MFYNKINYFRSKPHFIVNIKAFFLLSLNKDPAIGVGDRKKNVYK